MIRMFGPSSIRHQNATHTREGDHLVNPNYRTRRPHLLWIAPASLVLFLASISPGSSQASAIATTPTGLKASLAFCPDPWSLVSTSVTKPAARNGHSAIYDAPNNRMVIFGGADVSNYPLNDAWALALDTWTWSNLSPSGTLPPIVVQHMAIYDPVGQRMIQWGGGTVWHTLYDDTWELSLNGNGTPTWRMLTAAVVYDPVRYRMVIFGGADGWDVPGSCFNDVWALDLATLAWTQLTPSGTPPAPRGGVSGIYDPLRDRLVIHGGSDYPAVLYGDTWVLPFESMTWMQLSPGGQTPPARSGYAAVYDPVADAMVVTGGNDPATRNDTWALSLAQPAWWEVNTSGTLPAPRASQTAIYDPTLKRAVMFGGFIPDRPPYRTDETWTLDFNGFAIRTVRDVPNDQGRAVRLNFSAANADTAGAMAAVLQYEAYRRIDRAKAATATLSSGSGAPLWGLGDKLAGWEFVGAIPAHAECEYNMIVPTLGDLTATDTLVTAFFVRAATASPGVYYDTPVESGYSVDNLAPAAPANLRFQSPEILVWNEAAEADFNFYTVYGSSGPIFDPQTAYFIEHTTTPAIAASSPYDYLHVTTTDFAGNEGQAASISNQASGVPEGGMTTLSLAPAMPNPAVHETLIGFALPRDGNAALTVFDAAGRVVRRLCNERLSAGAHALPWDGRDDGGARVPGGVYMYRLDAENRSLNGRLVLIK